MRKPTSYRTRVLRFLAVSAASGLTVCVCAFIVLSRFSSGRRLTDLAEWATILAFALAAAGAVVWLLARPRRPSRPSPRRLDDHAAALAEQVLATEGRTLRQLVGGDYLAPVKFSSDKESRVAHDNVLTRVLVRFRDSGGRELRDISSVADYFSGLPLPRMLVIGPPGAGKTVMLLAFIVQMLQGRSDTNLRVPVRMSLTEYDPLTKELPSWLYSQIRDNYDMDEQTARLLVETGRILPVLDGLDEMDSDLLTPDLAIATLGEIDRYVVGREFGAILACREDEWARIISLSKPLLGGSLTQAALVRIQPLDCHQIVGYISENIRRRSLDPTAWAGVLRQLAKQPNGVITDALSRPLWLYLAMLALGEDPRPLLDAEEVADLRGQLLSDFIPAATALLSIPGHQRRYYSDVQVSSWLETLSCSTEESSGKARGDRAIVPDQLWRIVGLRKIRIYHLIATSVMLLAFSLLVLPTAVRSAHEFILSASAGAPHRHAVELIFLIFYCLLPLSALVGVLRYSAEASVKSIPIGRVRWRRFSLRMPARVNLWHWFIRELKASFGSNIPSKLLTGAILFFPFGLAAVIEGGFVISSILDDVGLGIVLAMAMTAWYLAASGVSLLWGAIRSLSPAELTMSKARRPYDVIRADRLAGLAASLIAIAGTIGHSSFNISKVLLSLCAAAAVFMLVARVTIRYYLALVSLSVSGKLPPCLMRFLNWSVSAGLLRDAGAAYEFRHAELQRWLAERVDR